MVFYRKYRPQKISELDSEEVRKTLESTVRAENIAHAFLFAGPKGLGKTSAARILAKIVNCEKKGNEPCNKCTQCVSITEGTNLDVLEIDGASNRGIDEVRDLREKINLAPFSAKQKVYIIDEVHMLTTEAFNALLKTLEEPPPHAMFILATTELQKVPETINSRCFLIPFTKPTEEELVRSLQRIVKGEKIKIDKDAVLKVAEFSDSSFRDGAKLLEQLVVAAGRGKITEKMVEELRHASNINEQIEAMTQFLAKRDAKEALTFLNREIVKGLNVKFFMEKMLMRLHELLLQKVEGKDVSFTLDELKRLIETFSKAALDVKYAVLPQLPLELAIIEWTLGDTAGRSSHAEGDARQPLFKDQNVPPSSLTERRLPKASKSSVKKSESAFSSPSGGRPSISINDIILRVKPHNHSIAGVLRGCSIKSYDGKKLIIETSYKFHKERLSEQKTQELLEKVAREIVGSDVSISVLFQGGEKR